MATRIDPAAFGALLARTGLSRREIARRYGSSHQNLDEIVRGRAVGPEVVRDISLVFADALREDPEMISRTLFIEAPDRPVRRTGKSFLERRLEARGEPVG